jgi:hypothetical protein
MKLTWALGLSLLIVLAGTPPIVLAATHESSPSIADAAPVIALPAKGEPDTAAACAEADTAVNAAKDDINAKWTVAAARAKTIGATDADIEAAKNIVLSTDTAEVRASKLSALYKSSSLQNVTGDDLGKIYAVVDARAALETALAQAAGTCPSRYGPSGSVVASPTPTGPMAGADAPNYGTPQVIPDTGAQMKVTPNGAPETGDGTLAS